MSHGRLFTRRQHPLTTAELARPENPSYNSKAIPGKHLQRTNDPMATSRHIEKMIEAAGVLLRAESSRRLGRLRLLKLMYIGNRRAIKELGTPIFVAQACAMKHGPVLTEVYELIKEEHSATDRWATFFARDGRDVRLLTQPPIGALSRAEVEILQKVSDEVALLDDFELVELTHGFEEWDRNYPDKFANESRPIPFEEIVRFASPDRAELILGEAADREAFDHLFST